MNSVIIEFPKGDTQGLKRAVASAKDVLYYVPPHEHKDRPVKVELFSEEMLPVVDGPVTLLSKGKYEVESIGYKYVDVNSNDDTYKVDISSVSEVKVTQDG